MNATAITQDRAPQEVTRSRRVGFLVYPDFQILDVSGPLEAFFFAGIALQRLGEPTKLATSALFSPPLPDLSGPQVESRSSQPRAALT